MNPTTTNLPTEHAQVETLHRALAEPFAFALLQWPLLLALLAAGDGGWWLALRIGCGVLLALALLAGYTRGVGFGNAMLAAAGCVAGAWWAWSSAWSVVWIAAISLLMLAAQNLRLRDPQGRRAAILSSAKESGGKVLLDNRPHSLKVDAQVTVHQHVAKAGEFVPRR